MKRIIMLAILAIMASASTPIDPPTPTPPEPVHKYTWLDLSWDSEHSIRAEAIEALQAERPHHRPRSPLWPQPIGVR